MTNKLFYRAKVLTVNLGALRLGALLLLCKVRLLFNSSMRRRLASAAAAAAATVVPPELLGMVP